MPVPVSVSACAHSSATHMLRFCTCAVGRGARGRDEGARALVSRLVRPLSTLLTVNYVTEQSLARTLASRVSCAHAHAQARGGAEAAGGRRRARGERGGGRARALHDGLGNRCCHKHLCRPAPSGILLDFHLYTFNALLSCVAPIRVIRLLTGVR